MVFGLWKRRKDLTPYTIYQSVMDQARQPQFFLHWGVADSLSGRFDMLIAHAVLVLRRLNKVDESRREEGGARAQAFSDVLFKDLDRALRDTGVSDRKVPKKLKLLAEAYLGRGQAFGEALDADDQTALADAIRRNTGGIVFQADMSPEEIKQAEAEQEEEAQSVDAGSLAGYLARVDASLAAQSDDDILNGRFAWPSVSSQAIA